MKNFVRLNKNEMKMIFGGDDRLVAGVDVTCNCNTKADCTGGQDCTNCGSNGEKGQPYGYCGS